MKINIPIDWISGHLRYGHLEGKVDMDLEAEKEFKKLLQAEVDYKPLTREEYEILEDYKEWIRDNCSIIIDDYRIDDCGAIMWEELLDN